MRAADQPIILAGKTETGTRYVQFWTESEKIDGRDVAFCRAEMLDGNAYASGDCNAGKSATLLDNATVSEASTSIAAAAEKVQLSAEAAARVAERQKAYSEQVSEAWGRVAPSYVPMPHDADGDITRWFTAQVPVSVVERGFVIAWSRRQMAKSARFRYAAGVVRRLLEEAGDV